MGLCVGWNCLWDGLMLGMELEFLLSEEQCIKGANVLCVVPEGEPWLVDGSSRKKDISSVHKKIIYNNQSPNKGNIE